MKNLPLLLITIIGSLALIVAIGVMFGRQDVSTAVADPAKLMASTRHSFGPEDATVTVVEFSDFQCPACRAAHPLVKQLKATYPDKVRVIYRHFPLTNIHPRALIAAQAAVAAGEQGKFWEMHDVLFDRQTQWAELDSDEAAVAAFSEYAAEIGIDKAKFQETIVSDPVKQVVAQDLADGNSLQVQATPTFFVNGQQLSAPLQLITTVESLLK
jgi:protein-disulfide isomerase